MRKTKIVCTVGPACESEEMLSAMLESGMNVARLNLSHGDYNEHGKRIANIKRMRAEMGKPLAIMLDTKGPEVRTGLLEGGAPVELLAGQQFVFTAKQIKGTAERVSVSYPDLCRYVKPGHRILLDDGLIGLEVLRVEKHEEVICRVIEGGILGEHKGVAVPGVDLHIPSLTDQDRNDILFGIEQGVDLIAASFVCRAEDVTALRTLLAANHAEHIGIFAKIENRSGVDNFDAILAAADGIMVARGDLGVEVAMEEVPVLQKTFIRKCNIAGKPVITATQMLDSMMRHSRPTRAEVSDVANSVEDGTDAVMLSGETASGKYPLEALRAMARIAEFAEQHADRHLAGIQDCLGGGNTITNAVSYACYSMAADLNAKAIITPTRSGYTVRSVAKYRPECVIVATTDDAKVYHQLAVVWGVQSLLVRSSHSTDGLMEESVAAVERAGLVSKGDLVILSAGIPVGMPGRTNLIKAQVVGEI